MLKAPKMSDVDLILDTVEHSDIKLRSDGMSHSLCILADEVKRLREIERELDEALVISHLGTLQSFESPKHAIAALAQYEQGIGEYFGTEDYKKIAYLIGSIFFFGGFEAETYNEAKLEELLRKHGFWYNTVDEAVEAHEKYGN